MTHLAVIIVHPGPRNNEDSDREGLIEIAWLLSAKKAREMRRKDRKTQYISIRQLKDECSSADYLEITSLLNIAANKHVGGVENIRAF